MIAKIVRAMVVLAIVGAIAGWFLTAPQLLDDPDGWNAQTADAKAGETLFWAGGCASCHAAPGAKGDAKLVMAGGHEFKTPFGTFYAPNISPDTVAGIGDWTPYQFANAMKRGVAPDGSHYYPAFPYTSYSRMTDKDVSDLWAFMKTLPKSAVASKDHDVGFPFNIRRGLGLWKRLYLKPAPVIAAAAGEDPLVTRGRYLVEGPAHCGACHTPRNLIGGPDLKRWMAGGISAEGNERIPNISPHESGIKDWSAGDIAESLSTGFTPEFDSFGSTMADVQTNMAKLPKRDLEAIAAYLKSIPAVPSAAPRPAQ